MTRFKSLRKSPQTKSNSGTAKLAVDPGIRYWPKVLSSSKLPKKKASDFHFQIVLATVMFVYFWILLIVYFLEKSNDEVKLMSSGSWLKSSGSKGLIISLKNQPSDFETSGFQYFPKVPVTLHRPKLESTSVWVLTQKSVGKFSIKDTLKYLNRLTQVSVLIKYYIAVPSSSRLSITGKSVLSNEEVTMDLTQYGDGYCTRVLFFGEVPEIYVEGSVSGRNGFIIIDELLIGFGYFVFDGLDEETCS